MPLARRGLFICRVESIAEDGLITAICINDFSGESEADRLVTWQKGTLPFSVHLQPGTQFWWDTNATKNLMPDETPDNTMFGIFPPETITEDDLEQAHADAKRLFGPPDDQP